MTEDTIEIPKGYRWTALGGLPEEWEVQNLKDIADFKNGINFSSEQKGKLGVLTVDVLNMYGTGILVSTNNLYRVNKKIKPEYLLMNNDLLLVRSSLKREGVGWVSLFKESTEPVTFCGFIIRARLNAKENVNPEFITNYLRTNSARNSLISSSGKVAITNINQGMLGRIEIPLPPLQEQKAIAHVLKTIQEAREKTEEVIRATKELKKSMVKHLFTYGPVAPEKAEKVELKETDIGKVPKDWEAVKLGEVVDIVYGIQAAVAHLTDSSIGIPILTNINITNEGALDTSTLRYYSLPEIKRERLKLRKGDVLFNWRSGSQRHVGKTALFDLDGDFTFSSFILRFRPREKLGSTFLHHFLNYLKVQGYFSKNRDQSSVNSVFNASLSAKIPIYVPPSIVQDKISEVLFSIDAKIEAEENKKNALEGLFKTLLHDLMTARIRVNNLRLEV